jgi:N4-gp56 family major capsid protein
VTTIVNGNYFDRAQETLMANGAEMPIGGGGSSTGVGTAPTLPGYPCVIHPFTYRTVKNLAGFVTPAQNAKMPEGCVGNLGMIYFYVSPDPASVSAGSRVRASGGGASTTVRNTAGTVDVYEDIFFSRRGFNAVKLSGKSLMNYVKPVGSAGALDPLEQVGTIGWKATKTQLRTNENWLLRGEHATEL